MSKMSLKSCFEGLVKEYLEAILTGEYYFDYWIGDEIGGVACISNEIFIGFDEIRFCVDNNILLDVFWDYQDWIVDEHFKKPKEDKCKDFVTEKYLKNSVMNFKNWLKREK